MTALDGTMRCSDAHNIGSKPWITFYRFLHEPDQLININELNEDFFVLHVDLLKKLLVLVIQRSLQAVKKMRMRGLGEGKGDGAD